MAEKELPEQKQMTGMLGHPVAENPIDRMFDAVYAHYGLNWTFWKSDVSSADELGTAISGAQALGYAGYAITVPYKIEAVRHLDDFDEDVRVMGCTNYVTIEDGRFVGHQNDGKGLVKAISQVTDITGQRLVMLGSGGSGRAMAVEVARAGASGVTIISRNETTGREVAAIVERGTGVPATWQEWRGEARIPEGTGIVLNATPLGSFPELDMVPIDIESLTSSMTVADVITNPRITPLLAAAAARGCTIVDGVEMLVNLACQIFTAWTGIDPDPEVFRTAVACALAE